MNYDHEKKKWFDKDGNEMPACYCPMPPFRDYCDNLSEDEKCRKCEEKYGMVDYIE